MNEDCDSYLNQKRLPNADGHLHHADLQSIEPDGSNAEFTRTQLVETKRHLIQSITI